MIATRPYVSPGEGQHTCVAATQEIAPMATSGRSGCPFLACVVGHDFKGGRRANRDDSIQ